MLIGVLALLLCVELSGCDQISNVFLTDQKRFLGTWESEEMWLGAPTVVVFTANSTFTSTIDFFDFKTTFEGVWSMTEGILTLEIKELVPRTNYTYQFSEDSKTLTLTVINGTDSYILRKQ
jgi:hypothetical protein